MKRPKREINTSLLDQVTADMLGGEDVDFLHDEGLRVERILLELVRPDPLQPRRVLPDRIYHAFHADQMTPTQALRELIQAAQLSAHQQGRPFSNVLELLGNPDDESSEELPALASATSWLMLAAKLRPLEPVTTIYVSLVAAMATCPSDATSTLGSDMMYASSKDIISTVVFARQMSTSV